MIASSAGVRIYLACEVTVVRKGMTGLAMLVQPIRSTARSSRFEGAGRD